MLTNVTELLTVFLVSTNWFKPSVFQTDKENKKCAGGAHSKRTVSTVPIDPTSFSWWWFSLTGCVAGPSLKINLDGILLDSRLDHPQFDARWSRQSLTGTRIE